jgi:hypothetical protein
MRKNNFLCIVFSDTGICELSALEILNISNSHVQKKSSEISVQIYLNAQASHVGLGRLNCCWLLLAQSL